MVTSLRKHARSVVGAGLLLSGAALTQGCLQRDVKQDQPNTSNVFVEQIASNKITAIDLLFVIDNSVSMGDKQEILKLAVPQMVGRLISPLCVDDDGNPTGSSADAMGRCDNGVAEFQPVNNIHIGVISSSLGGHGSNNCARDAEGKDNDDQGHLIATVRDGVPSSDTGFLSWTGGSAQDALALVDDFGQHVGAVGENGCGFEAPLEAWYRFLIDPEPPQEIVVGDNNRAASTGVDPIVLQQREAFLRPDGLVAIVVLTDENDCSAMDGGVYYNNAGFGYLIATTRIGGNSFNMPISTEICDSNPNDPCCFSCLQSSSPPDGCSDAASVCNGSGPALPADEDNANVRCFENRRRFGVDLLYPTSRYVDALSKPEIINARDGTRFPNPLLRGVGANAGVARDPGLVFFAGIVGVPWQDIATDASLDSGVPTMELLTAAELNVANVSYEGRMIDRWEVILGQPGLPATSRACEEANPACGAVPVAPADPFMVESIEPRGDGANPISGDSIVGTNSTDPTANNINGHEADHTVEENGVVRDDLQYACTFELEAPAPCDAEDATCDCSHEPSRSRPLCQPPGGGAAGNTQYYGKAYPGTRILQVLKDFGANSIVGSICPKNPIAGAPVAATDPNFGYNPAVQAIVDRLAEKLSGKCLPRELTVDNEGKVPCTVIEARPADGGELPCVESNGRSVPSPEVQRGIRAQLEVLGRCGEGSDTSCDTYNMCTINELLDVGRDDCLYNTAQPESLPNPGFCYIDPAKKEEGPDGTTYPAGGMPPNGEPGTNPLVENCPATERRLLRFVGADTPAPNTITFVACTGDAAGSDAPIPAPATPGGDSDM